MLRYIEIAATCFGLLQGLLVMLNKRLNWIAYIIQMMLMLVFSVCASLYGDAVNSAIYIVWGAIGFYLWGKAQKRITVSPPKERMLYIAAAAVGTAAVWIILSLTNDALPLLDAFTTVTSFIATYLMVRRRLDAWAVWFVNDIAYIAEYALLPERALYLMILNVVWTGMAVASFISWRREMKREAEKPRIMENVI